MKILKKVGYKRQNRIKTRWVILNQSWGQNRGDFFKLPCRLLYSYEVMRWSMSENLENSTFQAVLAYYSDPCKSVKNEDLSKLFIGDLEHTYSYPDLKGFGRSTSSAL